MGSETPEDDSEVAHVSASRGGLVEIFHKGTEVGAHQVPAEMFEMCSRNQPQQLVEEDLVQAKSKWFMAARSIMLWLVLG